MRGRTESDGSEARGSRRDWWGVVLEAPDANRLARFYSELLGWEITSSEPHNATVGPGDGVAYLGFQTAADYVRPAWPATDGSPHITMHLDFEVSDLALSVAHAVELGGQLADFQPQDDVRVILDPAGHPFCLYLGST